MANLIYRITANRIYVETARKAAQMLADEVPAEYITEYVERQCVRMERLGFTVAPGGAGIVEVTA